VSISGDYALIGRDDEGVYILKTIGVSGLIYNDINDNCAFEEEVGIAGRLAVVSPGNIVVQTNSVGYWEIDSLPI